MNKNSDKMQFLLFFIYRTLRHQVACKPRKPSEEVTLRLQTYRKSHILVSHVPVKGNSKAVTRSDHTTAYLA
jgi:hypothetical protein